MPTPPRSVFVAAPDGLRLHVREYGAAAAAAATVVCLPGLARTVADFAALAPVLACGDGRAQAGQGPPRTPRDRPARRVIAIDSRGRGLSEYDEDPDHYNLLVELSDLGAVLDALAVGPAVYVGSSRGGLLTMLLAAARTAAITGVVLHDIGPVIELQGLVRLKSYVGKLPQPRTFAEGAAILRRVFEQQFPRLTDAQWLAFAQRSWRRAPSTAGGGTLEPVYDVRLSRTLEAVDGDTPLPTLWNEFDALAGVPVLVIRGARSDLLAPATVAAMAARHPGLESIEVPDQGHVPLLEGDLLGRIAAFVGRCENANGRP